MKVHVCERVKTCKGGDRPQVQDSSYLGGCREALELGVSRWSQECYTGAPAWLGRFSVCLRLWPWSQGPLLPFHLSLCPCLPLASASSTLTRVHAGLDDASISFRVTLRPECPLHFLLLLSPPPLGLVWLLLQLLPLKLPS